MKEINILLQHQVINILRQYYLDLPAAILLSFTLAQAIWICWVSKHDYQIAFISFLCFFLYRVKWAIHFNTDRWSCTPRFRFMCLWLLRRCRAVIVCSSDMDEGKRNGGGTDGLLECYKIRLRTEG